MEDNNAIIRAYLVTQPALTGIVSTRIYVPRLPENATLPAIGFFTRGGVTNPHIPPLVTPSVQFDCWGSSFREARLVYRALYGVLQGIQNVSVSSPAIVIGTDGNDYTCILAHTSNARNKPITGALTATYWVVSGSTGIGEVWVTGTDYRTTYYIKSAMEEVQGQDLADVELQKYFRVLTFFSIMVTI